MMKVMINHTIEAFWNSLSITGMRSPKQILINQCPVSRFGEVKEIQGDAGVLETTIYGKDEDLAKLLHIGEIKCKCDNGMVFNGIIKEFSTKKGVSGAMGITMQLYRL